jgi:protein-S-isoprenylcysteine O-methyltransferase Ste14
MPIYDYAILAAGWLMWVTPFFLIKKSRASPATLDRRARWGIVLQALAYSLLWQNRFWERSLDSWRLAFSVVFMILASVFSWSGARALGRQWRFDAGLNADHQLVTSGVYRIVRHPIYSSMLWMLIGTGLMIAPVPMLLLSLLLFVIGAEIRVRVEDRLLASRFGEQFYRYQRTVAAYIPLVI